MRISIRHIIKDWIAFTCITFFLYDLMWILMDYDRFWQNLSNDTGELCLDLVYCALFSGSSILVSYLLIYHGAFRSIGYGNQVRLGIGIMAVNIVLAIGCAYTYNLIAPFPTKSDYWSSVYAFCLIATLTALIHLNKHYGRIMMRQNEEAITFKKRLLKMRFDPHFVSNSLSILAELTRIDPIAAEKFTICLSRIYRSIVNNIEYDLVSIKQALDFAQDYVSILKIRFPEQIDLRIKDCESSKHEYIIIFSLQLLIENALKHNSPTKGDKLVISISREEDAIVVSNNLIKPLHLGEGQVPSFGIGLENLYERYRLECEKNPIIRCYENIFEVRLPIIKRRENETCIDY